MSLTEEIVFIQVLNLLLLSLIISSDKFSHANSIKYPPRASLLHFAKGIEYTDNRLSRILTGNPSKGPFSNSHSSISEVPEFFCRQRLQGLPLNDSLVCACKKGEQKLIDISKGSFGWSTINKKPKTISKLYLFFCKFSIGNLALKSLNLNSLAEFYIAESDYLMLYDDSLDFSSLTKVRVTISRIGNLVFLPRLHASISTLVLDNIEVNNLSTDEFVPLYMHQKKGFKYEVGNIVIQNCLVNTRSGNVVSPKNVKVHSIKLDNVTFDHAPRYQFLNLLVSTDVVFTNMKLEASNRGIINLKAETLVFQNCTIKNWRPLAINAMVDHVIFNQTTLQEPQRQAIMSLLFLRNTSMLEFVDVTLDDPAEGTLVTKFPKVIFKNIFVKRCKCDLVEYLFTTPEEFEARHGKNLSHVDVSTDLMQKLERDLSQHIKCHPLNNPNVWDHPSRECNNEVIIEKEVESKDSKYIFGVSIGIFAIASIVVFGVVYFSRQKEKKKINLVNKWQFHSPKEPQMVDDSKQYMCYISPSDQESTIFSTIDVSVEMRDTRFYDSVSGSMYEPLRPVTSTYTKKSCHSLDELSRGGSIVIHEDSD